MVLASKIKSGICAWLCVMVVMLGLGENRAWGFFAQPQPAPGVYESTTQEPIRDFYDASQYDASDYAVAAKTGAPVKNLTEQAADLVPLNGGRNRVTLRSPSQQMEVDLAGKTHGGVPTPHTKVSPLNPRAPNQPAFNTKNSPVEPATQQDIRTVRRYLERQN